MRFSCCKCLNSLFGIVGAPARMQCVRPNFSAGRATTRSRMQVFAIQPARGGRQKRSGGPIDALDQHRELRRRQRHRAARLRHARPPKTSMIHALDEQAQPPVPSRNRIFKREAFLPRKTNRWPEKGSFFRCFWISVASPSRPLRMSVWPSARCTFSRLHGTTIMMLSHYRRAAASLPPDWCPPVQKHAVHHTVRWLSSRPAAAPAYRSSICLNQPKPRWFNRRTGACRRTVAPSGDTASTCTTPASR